MSVTFQDPKRKKHIWHVDVTFLASNYLCIFGQGCQGVLTEKSPEMAQGCCSYGAHSSGAKDRAHVNKVAAKLTADDWQFLKKGRTKKGVWAKVGKDDYRTRLVDDACIFLNRPGFAAGPLPGDMPGTQSVRVGCSRVEPLRADVGEGGDLRRQS